MKRIVLGLFLLCCVLLALGIFFPYLFKGRIVRLIEAELNKTVEAELRFDHDIRLNLFRSFPKLHLEVDDILIRSKQGGFKNDTLCHIGELRTDLDLMALYRSEALTIAKLELREPFMHLETAADSTFNWDIFPEEEEEEDSSAIALELTSFIIRDGRFSLEDETIDIELVINDIDHRSAIEMTGSQVAIDAETEAGDLFFSYLKVPYLDQHRFTQQGPIAMDLDELRFRFDQNRCTLNGLPMDAQVEIQVLENGQFFNIEVAGAESTLPHYISLIPAVFQSDYANMVSQGSGALDFSFKGLMSEERFPAYHLGLRLDQGAFHYPEAKAQAQGIGLDLQLDNPTGEDADATLDIKRLAAEINGQRFEAQTLIRQVFTHPHTSGLAKGRLDLAQLAALIPENNSAMRGTIDLDVNWDGPVERVEAFKASGKIGVRTLSYQAADQAFPLEIDRGALAINNDRISLSDLAGRYGKNELEMQAECRDYLPYIRNTGVLFAKVNIESKSLNINDLLGDSQDQSAAEEPDSSTAELRLPTDLWVEFNARCDQLTLGEDTYKNTLASGVLKDGDLRIDEFRSDAFGGSIALQAEFRTKDQHHLDLKLDASEILMQQVLDRFGWIRKYVPVGSQWNPRSMFQIRFNSPLDAGLRPYLDQLTASGLMAFDQLALKDIPWAKAIDQQLGLSHLSGKQLKDMLVKFNVRDGKLFVDPIDLLLDQTTLHLEGSSKLDGSIAYTGGLDIPSALFKGQQNSLNRLFAGSKLTDYQWSPEDQYQMDVRIDGSFADPIVKLSMESIKKAVGDQFRDQLGREQAKLRDQANSEVQAVKDSLDRAAADAKQRLQDELDRQRQEAEDRARAEAERQKKEAESKLKDRFKGILNR